MDFRESALDEAEDVAEEMEGRRRKAVANHLSETTTYLLPEYPARHRRRIRTNDMIE